jgi:hypothetical protein
LNPKKYFIIITALFGNGQSTSPSNSNIKPFPKVTIFDNVRAQHKLVTEHFGIKHARAVLGWSMGAGQTFQWATSYPDFMDIAVPFCGAAKTSLHNQVFLEGVKSALLSAKKQSSAGSCEDGVLPEGDGFRTWTAEEKNVGLKAFGRVYAGWGFSQAFYRAKLYESVLGFKDLEDFMENFWETWALSKGMSKCPSRVVIDGVQIPKICSQCYILGKLATAPSKSHTMEILRLPCKQSRQRHLFCLARQTCTFRKTPVLNRGSLLTFPRPEDSEIEVENMRPGIGKVETFPSIWGHWAGGPGDNEEDVKWLDEKLREVGL